MHNFKELAIWKRSMQLAQEVYKITSKFPEEEKFGLISQMRRSAVSIISNIAEGAGRNTDKSFSNFLAMSLGSQFELESQLLLSTNMNFDTREVADNVLEELTELQKMTRALGWKLSNV